MAELLILRVDAVPISVPDLEAGLAFYRDKLGHELRWRNESAAGLAMPHSDTELVIQTALDDQETDLLVEPADGAAHRFAAAGGTGISPAPGRPVWRAAVV